MTDQRDNAFHDRIDACYRNLSDAQREKLAKIALLDLAIMKARPRLHDGIGYVPLPTK